MDKILEKIILKARDGQVSDEETLLILIKDTLRGQNLPAFPSNIILRKTYRTMVKEGRLKPDKGLENLLVTKKMRSLSGVAVITVLTKPWPCPGECLYCPTQEDVPKSYLSSEPAVMRAILCDYNPYKQVRARLDSLELEGHPTDKIELIVIGGTFSALPKNYQEEYIAECFRALNGNDQFPISNFQSNSNDQISNGSSHSGHSTLRDESSGSDSKRDGRTPESDSMQARMKEKGFLHSSFQEVGWNDTLQDAKKKNETAKHRCVGLTLETRPDYITEEEVKWFRYLGATRVELGVQSVFDDVLALNKRGHKVEQTVQATKLLKDAGFKICYHMMPGLPGSDPGKDLEMFRTIFTDSRFQPDYVKIYPCVVTKGAELYKWWKNGKYQPYSDKELESLICEIKKIVPYHVRIMRLIRDIPSSSIEAGSKVSNMRQNVQRRLSEEGERCKCIRCREAGLLTIDNSQLTMHKASSPVIPSDFAERRVEGSFSQNTQFPISNDQLNRNDQSLKKKDSGLSFAQSFGTGRQARMTILFREEYQASGGKEYFLSYESEDRSALYSLLRLRLTKGTFITEIRGCALIRELHTYGQQIEIGQYGENQHKGLGKKLILEAAKIAKEKGYKKIAVIAGVGVRDYYRKFGYKFEGEYMIKVL